MEINIMQKKTTEINIMQPICTFLYLPLPFARSAVVYVMVKKIWANTDWTWEGNFSFNQCNVTIPSNVEYQIDLRVGEIIDSWCPKSCEFKITLRGIGPDGIIDA